METQIRIGDKYAPMSGFTYKPGQVVMTPAGLGTFTRWKGRKTVVVTVRDFEYYFSPEALTPTTTVDPEASDGNG